MNQTFEGIYPALVTPFHTDGTIDTDTLQKLVKRNLVKGVDGFYVSGSTGESYLLTMDERKKVLEAVIEAAEGKKVIANIGMIATEQSIELAKHAQKCGVDAISSVPPFYFPFTMKELVQYYVDLAESTELPVIVYNIPAMSKVNFSIEDLDLLFQHEKIIGVKHTSYDLFQLQQIVAGHPDKSIFIGHDEIFLSALSVGVKAGIGSTYNIMAEKFIQMRELFAQGNLTEALQIQNEVNEIVTALCKVGVFKGIKAILKMQGLDCGVCRRPFLELEDTQIAELEKIAEKNGIL